MANRRVIVIASWLALACWGAGAEGGAGPRWVDDSFEDFVKVLGTADAVLLAEVYPAGESPIVAADGRALARALRIAGKVDAVFVDEIGAMPQAIVDQARDGDVVIAMGAGTIGNVPGQVIDLSRGTP